MTHKFGTDLRGDSSKNFSQLRYDDALLRWLMMDH